MTCQGKSGRNLEGGPETERSSFDSGIRGAHNDMSRKGILFEEKVKGGFQFLLRHTPGDEGSLGKIVGDQGLPDPADRSRLKHGPDACEDGIKGLSRLFGNFGKGILMESGYLILRDGKNGGVNGIVVLDGKHGKGKAVKSEKE